jgi:pimeloyl-ACP methyl ester carboxylesterase
VRCPVTLLAGRFDSLVDVADMRATARALPAARFRELLGTHFVPLQYPGVMVAEMRALAQRSRDGR